MKYICKDFWTAVYKKQIDNLRTNHQVNMFRYCCSFGLVDLPLSIHVNAITSREWGLPHPFREYKSPPLPLNGEMLLRKRCFKMFAWKEKCVFQEAKIFFDIFRRFLSLIFPLLSATYNISGTKFLYCNINYYSLVDWQLVHCVWTATIVISFPKERDSGLMWGLH